MKKRFFSITKYFDRLNESVGQFVSWLTSALVVLICIDVIARYVFNNTGAWVTELEWHLFALIFLLGAGYTLKNDKHVRVDLYYSKFSKRDKAWVDIVGLVFFLIPWCLIIIYYSSLYALGSWENAERSADPGGLPARYLIKFSIAVGFLLLLLQAISMLLKNIFEITKKPVE